MGDRPEYLCRLVEDAQDVFFFCHVAGKCDGFAAGFFHRVGDLCCRFGIADVVDGNVIAAFGRKFCRRRTNSTASAGDKQNRSRHCKLLRWCARG
jgi:hypothetical protein